MSDSKSKIKKIDFGELVLRKRALTVSEGIAGVSWIPETLRLITRSGWYDGVLDRGWAGNAELLLVDQTLSVVWLPVFCSL